MDTFEDLVAHYRAQLARNQEILDSLESGRMSVRGSDGDGPMRDMTEEAKALQRRIIDNYESAIEYARTLFD
jgi:hypothetical protein